MPSCIYATLPVICLLAFISSFKILACSLKMNLCPLSISGLSAGTVFSFFCRKDWRNTEGCPGGLKQSGHFLQHLSSVGSKGKECLQCKRSSIDPWVGKIPWRSDRLPAPVFLPGEFHGQRNLKGYSPWGCKELDRTQQLQLFSTLFLQCTKAYSTHHHISP